LVLGQTNAVSAIAAPLHLHGGVTPWISDGTPHQWVTPDGETTAFLKGVSVQNPNVQPSCEPAQIPSTPNVSVGMEAFNNTPIVNGTAYPATTVDPKAYRYRILNAANDRFWNLQWYVADPTSGTLSEVALNPAELAAAQTDPNVVPTPDTTKSPVGPNFVQIGTEGGFLPAPTVIANQPITWITDPTRFDFGNVDQHALLLAPAEADVVVDFSQYRGKTLILYNDAPAAFPARQANEDLYTGGPDMTPAGAPSTLPGYGPNTPARSDRPPRAKPRPSRRRHLPSQGVTPQLTTPNRPGRGSPQPGKGQPGVLPTRAPTPNPARSAPPVAPAKAERTAMTRADEASPSMPPSRSRSRAARAAATFTLAVATLGASVALAPAGQAAVPVRVAVSGSGAAVLTGWEPGLLAAGLPIVIIAAVDPAGLVASSQADLAVVDGNVPALPGESVTPLAHTGTGIIVALLPATGSTAESNALLLWAEAAGQAQLPAGVLPNSPPPSPAPPTPILPTPTPTLPTPTPTLPTPTAADPSSPATPTPDPSLPAAASPPAAEPTASTGPLPASAGPTTSRPAPAPGSQRPSPKRVKTATAQSDPLRTPALADLRLNPAGLTAIVTAEPTPLTGNTPAALAALAAVPDPLIAPVDTTTSVDPPPASPGTTAAPALAEVASVRQLSQPWLVALLSAALALGAAGALRLRTRNHR
jgi:hypothetical protein